MRKNLKLFILNNFCDIELNLELNFLYHITLSISKN